MKIIVLLMSLLATALCIGQPKTPTLEEASAFFDKEDKTGINFFLIRENDELSNELYQFYSTKAEGEIIISGTTIRKVVHHRIHHIQNFYQIRLEQTLTEKEAIELEKIIIAKYMAGIPFEKLVEEYSIDKYFSTDGLNMALEHLGKMGEEMQKHNVNEIFASNDPANNVFKVAIKNNNPLPVKVTFIWEAEYK